MTDFRLSLAYAAKCLIEGKPIESDGAWQEREFKFAEHERFFEPLVGAFHAGKIRARGRLTINLLDRCELDVDCPPSAIRARQRVLRREADWNVWSGAESKDVDITPPMWSYEGVTWEKSTLWIFKPRMFEEKRLQAITVSPVVQTPPDLPYVPQKMICFEGVKLSVKDVVAWAEKFEPYKKKRDSTNERKAGRKPTEDWPKIADELVNRIADGEEWKSWHKVYMTIKKLLNKPQKDSGRVISNLQKYLAEHRPELLARLRVRINSSRSNQPEKTRKN